LRNRIALAAVATVALAVPATAGAATKTVDMGLPLSSQTQFNRKLNVDVNDFFPHGVTIHVGDSIKFVPTGFHTVDLPPKGGKALPFAAPTGDTISGVNDAAGSPFWFNGQTQLNGNPQVFGPGALGKRLTYDGSKRVESGPAQSNNPPPMVVKFTKVGSYKYFCDIHQGMNGVVHVVAKTAAIPSAKADAGAVKAQLSRDLKIGKKLASTKAPSGTVLVGPAGAHGVEYFGFAPASQSVPVGTTLKFAMPAASLDLHTATTGPGDPNDPKQASTYLGQLEAAFNGPAPEPRVILPSDPVGTPASLTPSLHGNGFWNSGILANHISPLASSNSVTFNAPGTYTFYCMIHTFMKGTVTVTG
jgi:plastocyanin